MIGVFDSGYGGLNILKTLLQRLPEYDYLYLGDNARAPYGARSCEVIYRFTLQGVRYLFSQDCALVVLACNTASARALRTIQQRYLAVECKDRRVLGVIRPSAEALARIPVGEISSEPRFDIAGKVAILGTQETIQSNSFVLELQKLAPRLEIYQQACPLLAPLVEAGEISGEGPSWFVRKYLAELRIRCDAPKRILLACTHYAALVPIIRQFLPNETEILTQDEIIAERLKDWLVRHPEQDIRLGKTGKRLFLTTDDASDFAAVGRSILGTDIDCKAIRLPGE
ncbi:MAG: glutamate racemase [Verrucomicrobia bacterium]|nr:glutamate racemase [Verrucomicrobiota bacterium]MBV9671424.1 glutamate racemase [Verrucomicrobiota bacterium]